MYVYAQICNCGADLSTLESCRSTFYPKFSRKNQARRYGDILAVAPTKLVLGEPRAEQQSLEGTNSTTSSGNSASAASMVLSERLKWLGGTTAEQSGTKAESYLQLPSNFPISVTISLLDLLGQTTAGESSLM